jgi:hypothetical protein
MDVPFGNSMRGANSMRGTDSMREVDSMLSSSSTCSRLLVAVSSLSHLDPSLCAFLRGGLDSWSDPSPPNLLKRTALIAAFSQLIAASIISSIISSSASSAFAAMIIARRARCDSVEMRRLALSLEALRCSLEGPRLFSGTVSSVPVPTWNDNTTKIKKITIKPEIKY